MIGVIIGDCLDALPAMPDGSVDAVVCDPPYGLEFMGKEWDRLSAWRDGGGFSKPGIGERPTQWASYGGETANPSCRTCGGRVRGAKKCACDAPDWHVQGQDWKPGDRDRARSRRMQDWHEAWAAECLRVLKPGGHLLAFGGTRTYHRLACAVEDAGFEIRDCLAWLYGSGFPKSLNVGKAIDKPHYGPVCDDGWITPDARAHQGEGTALKPAFEPIAFARKPLIGTVAANVLAHSTGGLNIDACRITGAKGDGNWKGKAKPGYDGGWKPAENDENAGGRWPANVLLDPEAAVLLDEQAPNTGGGGFPSSGNGVGDGPVYGKAGPNFRPRGTGRVDANAGASRFFYCAKASSKERNAGLDERNGHPTVKPVELMRWLVRLVTPPGGLVIDPFAGSGTTGIACTLEGLNFIGIEREADYVEIARARIAHWGLPS